MIDLSQCAFGADRGVAGLPHLADRAMSGWIAAILPTGTRRRGDGALRDNAGGPADNPCM